MTRRPLPLLLTLAAAAAVVQGDEGWRQASPARRIELPADHASHPDYRLEWWYYTGHLRSDDGRSFGYQLTFFRVGVDRVPRSPSRWAVRDLHMAHLAVTDIREGRHLFAERLNRAGVGWAGAATDRYHVWNEDWRVQRQGERHVLRAATPELGVDLMLGESPPLLHGENGFSRKGATPGNASHYYSMTRMPTHGTLRVGERARTVSGTSWMDHEFGTSFLESTQQGWDWFSVQLDDGSDLMVFQLRETGGGKGRHSSGTLHEADGRVVPLGRGDFELAPETAWRSPQTGAMYPLEWVLRVPAARLALRVRALVAGQELTPSRSGVSYWEGAIAVEGTRAGRAVAGRGYLEMTGYAGRPMGEVLRGPP